MAGSIIAGGDIRQLTIKGREFTVEPDAAIKLSLGGRVNEAALAGNNKTVVKQKSKLAGFSDCPVIIDSANADLEFLQEIENDAEEVPTVMTLANGATYGGKLMIIGEIDVDTGAGSATLEMRGSKFEQI